MTGADLPRLRQKKDRQAKQPSRVTRLRTVVAQIHAACTAAGSSSGFPVQTDGRCLLVCVTRDGILDGGCGCDTDPAPLTRREFSTCRPTDVSAEAVGWLVVFSATSRVELRPGLTHYMDQNHGTCIVRRILERCAPPGKCPRKQCLSTYSA